MAQDVPTIKVLVACHKPTVIPDSDLYLPVQLGAVSAEPIFGMQPDNEGDNISDRNFSFCELSAQYWGWKNLGPEVDYVGLCHYRRYFCFDGRNHLRNDHAQIEIPRLTPTSAVQLRLSDDALITERVAGCDLVVPVRWDVRHVPTPLGPKPTIRSHMVAYDLLNAEDFDTLERLCERLQPEYAPYVSAYLDGYMYQGYNCYIARRDLFDRLCAFEFDVLQAFDAQFNYEGLSAARQRIVGYLGEVLISAFTMRLEDEGGLRIDRWPLTFFQDTPSPEQLVAEWNAGVPDMGVPSPTLAQRARAFLLPPGSRRLDLARTCVQQAKARVGKGDR